VYQFPLCARTELIWNVLLTAHLLEKAMAYFDGTSPSFPVLRGACNQVPRSTSAVYYLLADCYFKVNEWVSTS
jgi:hypothetical protein